MQVFLTCLLCQKDLYLPTQRQICYVHTVGIQHLMTESTFSPVGYTSLIQNYDSFGRGKPNITERNWEDWASFYRTLSVCEKESWYLFQDLVFVADQKDVFDWERQWRLHCMLMDWSNALLSLMPLTADPMVRSVRLIDLMDHNTLKKCPEHVQILLRIIDRR